MIHYISQHPAIRLVISKHPRAQSKPPSFPLCGPSPVYAPMTPLHCHQRLTQQQPAADTQETSPTSALQRSASQWKTLSQKLHQSELYGEKNDDTSLHLHRGFNMSIHSHLLFWTGGFRCIMLSYSMDSHLSLPTECQSYWSEPAPPPLHLSLAGPAGKTRSDGE